jgi:hypothetical protein
MACWHLSVSVTTTINTAMLSSSWMSDPRASLQLAEHGREHRLLDVDVHRVACRIQGEAITSMVPNCSTMCATMSMAWPSSDTLSARTPRYAARAG